MVTAHSLGFPRIGLHREMKFAVESYWKQELSEQDLRKIGQQIRQKNWEIQAQAGLKLLPVGDFSWYDHVLDMSIMLGVIPSRYPKQNDLTTYFQMARGEASIRACEMTKWFDTNYHYIVPEFETSQQFKIDSTKLFDEISEARALGYKVKPIIIGPLTYLWLGKSSSPEFDKLQLLPQIIEAYQQLLSKFAEEQIDWVQMDEPILVLDLPLAWRNAFKTAYESFKSITPVKLMIATYFGGLEDNINLACELPVAGLHIDAIRSSEQISQVMTLLHPDSVLSVGIINGRNIWKTNLKQALEQLKPIHKALDDRLWISGSCSFLHSPVDLETETDLDDELKQWLGFAKQKTGELVCLAKALNDGEQSVVGILDRNEREILAKKTSARIHNSSYKELQNVILERSPYEQRAKLQKDLLNLPLLPTTTIGSFPQTQTIRQLRNALKKQTIAPEQYKEKIKEEIRIMVEKQLEIGLDVLVHGEAERNDMVEYFAEHLNGFAFTLNGWVQSYGSRCVKPPIIYGDVSRPKPITVEWSRYAKSLSNKPMKGMLTGPVTIVMWSFVREDQPLFATMQQVAMALRDEVKDLETSGINVIQIDEPAFREGLPLRKNKWQKYLDEAVRCFKLTSSCVHDSTQIHTHMCYSEFNDIIEFIAAMDADVISIETSRSNMELLAAFNDFAYPNEIGPGVYDIHSPRVPTVDEIKDLIYKAAKLIPIERIWINPDCGLKTRAWPEVTLALKNMVHAANMLRKEY